jgi:preprotein translocase subunit SecG
MEIEGTECDVTLWIHTAQKQGKIASCFGYSNKFLGSRKGKEFFKKTSKSFAIAFVIHGVTYL